MTQPNIYGLQGMTGYTSGAIGMQGMTGIVGPQGMTGTTGVQGPQGMTGEDIYDMMLSRYKRQGFDMKWEMKTGGTIKIKDMEDSHVRNCINMLKRNTQTDTRRAWIDIFTDVIVKRRRLKLDKIKNKLNSQL